MKTNAIDWRYAPSKVLNIRYGWLPVARYVAHPAGTHEASPIINSFVALELIDSAGVSHWYGVDEAKINSELRMIARGGFINPVNELARSWKKAKHAI